MRLHLLWSALLMVGTGCAASRPRGGTTTEEASDVAKGSVAASEGIRAAAATFAPALASTDAGTRSRALLALARLERLDAVEPILAAVKDPDPSVRALAAFAAGQLDLALDPQRAAHEEMRQVIESVLVAALAAEGQAPVRIALIRAVGRLGSRAGLDELVALTTSPHVLERREALVAVGVSGARRQASKKDDPALLAAVTLALSDNDDEVRTAAAYAAFRQKLALPHEAVAGALSGGSQTRIFLARAMAAVDAAVADAHLPTLLDDPDWRVQVEALRAVKTRPEPNVESIARLLESAVKKYTAAGQLHVIGESCLLLADVGAPPSLPVVAAAFTSLPTGAATARARCTCAAAVEVLGGDGTAVEGCTSGLSDELQARHALEAVEHSHVPSTEKALALAAFLDTDHLRVRMAAAGALCTEASFAAADAAAARLVAEPDAGVTSALLECFAEGNNGDVLLDQTLVTVSERFSSPNAFANTEPLLAVATLARTRPGPAMQALRHTLLKHADAGVRDAAGDVPSGERAPGPRALALPEPAPGTLPLAAVLHTSRGEIVIAFERELAPRTVKNFSDLAAKKIFNGTPFHRVIADFVSQGGDPRGDGSGGPGFSVPCENSDASFSRGAEGMAHAGKDTGGSQFFLTHSLQPHLDGRYTLFARVVDGDDVMDALQKDDILVSVEITTALRKARK